MKKANNFICPNCNSPMISLKKEATYLYTYNIDSNDRFKKTNLIPFIFDNRMRLEMHEYIQCENCGKKFQFKIDNEDNRIQLTIEKKALQSNNLSEPKFLNN
ncbi:hypothetical protein [Abyssisolibacter fermentans]|uniref:hypothetical protein n=1 Tax=Abyssisolibacter fermentans TaxID=1766203 RepID=UPI000832491E|nr:hypothetical protein [Abyssisolibacter fermentans]